MTFSFLVTLREGVEMALIVAILLGYLRSVGQKRHFREIWIGVGVAALACIAIGVALEVASRELDKRLVEAFEGFAMLFAVVVLTGMALWMKRNSAGLSGALKADVDQALNKGSLTALVLLAASSVGREGLETVLFLFAGSTNAASGQEYLLGGVLGFAVAGVVGVAIYRGSQWLPIRQFMLISTVVLLILAAGMLASSMVKLYEAAIITDLGSRPWDTEHLISITSTEGKFLNALLGYDSAPSMLQIGLYWGYLVMAVTAVFLVPSRRPSPRRPQAPMTGPLAQGS